MNNIGKEELLTRIIRLLVFIVSFTLILKTCTNLKDDEMLLVLGGGLVSMMLVNTYYPTVVAGKDNDLA